MPAGAAPKNPTATTFSISGAAVKRGLRNVSLLLAGVLIAGCSVTIGPRPTPGPTVAGQPTNTPIEQIRVDITYVPSPTMGPPTPTRGPAGEPIKYTIKSGDTLSGIADQYGITVEDIVKFNNIADPNQVYEGEVILIPPPTAEESANQTPTGQTPEATAGASPTETKVP